jgi:hypothetical protein
MQTIKTLNDFLEIIKENHQNYCEDGQKNSLFYRGLRTKRDVTEEIHRPSIYYENLIESEPDIFKEFISIFPDEVLPLKTTIEKLIFMRHYGFPTRLADISANPLISLFFSCFTYTKNQDSSDKDGMVLVYKVPTKEIKYCDSDSITVLANLAKCPMEFWGGKEFKFKSMGNDRDDAEIRKRFNEQLAVMYLNYEQRKDTAVVSDSIIQYETLTSVFCLRPSMNNRRVIRQDGYFFIFGIDGDKRKCAKIKDDWILDPIYIDAESKEKILKELNRLNINEAFVYPEFEHISKYLREKYKKE